ncbi:MAG: glycoside hydrolase family 113 [Polyangiales bacterium]
MKSLAIAALALSTLPKPAPGPLGWQAAGLPAVRGMTIGPIENALHPNVGYGSATCGTSFDVAKDLGATWVAITPFGRMWSTRTTSVDLSFEQPFGNNAEAVGRAIDQAHARGLRVMLVPHLWIESGGWRGEIEPFAPPDKKRDDGGYDIRGRATEAGIKQFAQSYRTFLLAWADVARAHDVEIFSIGVELRSWATSARGADDLRALVRDVRARFSGILTYSANWDDVDDVVILREIDVIGINAFYPLADKNGATRDELLAGGKRVGEKLRTLAANWGKPVMFTEIGYTTRPDPAVRPWEWPDSMKGVPVDEQAQADAYRALLAGVIGEPSFAGFFVWRQFADPNDVSQEASWGFPIRGKLAELEVREVFASHFSADGFAPPWASLGLAAYGAPGLAWSFPRIFPQVANGPGETYPAPR